ncbi:MAG: hypothetical protein Kilf2KO_03720 [Rhodospirillales bacterium]
MQITRLSATLLVATLLSLPAAAGDLASGDQIADAITGNTVQGSMLESGAYTEYYTDGGAIKGDGYVGSWSIDGDLMCFQYGTDPAGCYHVRIQGDQITWVQKGKDEGTGTIVSGNPNGF